MFGGGAASGLLMMERVKPPVSEIWLDWLDQAVSPGKKVYFSSSSPASPGPLPLLLLSAGWNMLIRRLTVPTSTLTGLSSTIILIRR